MSNTKEKSWYQGFAAACAITLKNHDEPTMVAETYKCAFMSLKECKEMGVDKYDIDILKPIIKEIERKSKTNKDMKILTNAPVLHLNLKAKWFDMIEARIKPEEYRDTSVFWNKVFTHYIKIKGKLYHPTDVIICFSNGYTKQRRQMFFRCKYVKRGFGKPEWGAEPGKQYHILSLGEREYM